jgi:hypothetical protein
MGVNFEMGATIWDTNSQMGVQGKIKLHKQTINKYNLQNMPWLGKEPSPPLLHYILWLVAVVASKWQLLGGITLHNLVLDIVNFPTFFCNNYKTLIFSFQSQKLDSHM